MYFYNLDNSIIFTCSWISWRKNYRNGSSFFANFLNYPQKIHSTLFYLNQCDSGIWQDKKIIVT